MSEEIEEQLRKQAIAIRVKLNKIEHEKWLQDNARFVDTYWKYRNCYSCPDKPNDYWWCYRHLLSIQHGTQYFKAFTFQTDKYGNQHIEHEQLGIASGGWIQIPRKEYMRAWKAFKSKVNKRIP